MTNIHNWEHYQESLWDWTAYNDCFGGNIRISDIDGVVERNGNFLWIETKGIDADVTTGQAILFDQLIKLPGHHVLIIYGDTDKPHSYRFWGHYKRRQCTQEDIEAILKRWYAVADSRSGREIFERSSIIDGIAALMDRCEVVYQRGDLFGAKLAAICYSALRQARALLKAERKS